MVVKKVLKNLLIFFGILVALAFITLGCLYFIPNLTIFGIKFKKAGLNDIQKVNLKEYENQCDTITLNVGHVNLDVLPSSGDYRVDLNIQLKDDAVGLVKESKSTLSYTVKLEGTNLIIDFAEPEGLILWKNTWATLTLSEYWLTNSNKTLIINGSDSKVLVSTSVAASNITSGYPTLFKYVEFNSTGKGTFQIIDDAKDVKLHTTKGSSILSGAYNNVEFISDKGELHFNDIGNLKADVKNSYIKGKNIPSTFNFKGGDGKIEIENIGSETLEAETVIEGKNITATINNLFGKIKSNTQKGTMYVENYKTSTYYLNEIKTDSAKIQIDKIEASKLKLETNKGAIVAAACGAGDVEAVSSRGKITFTGKAGDKTFIGSAKLTNEKGEINLEEISCIVNAETTGSGKINASFVSVNSASTLKSASGKITANMALSGSYTISAKSTKGSVTSNLTSISANFTDKSHELKSVAVGGGSEINVLNITSEKGNIIINQK